MLQRSHALTLIDAYSILSEQYRILLPLVRDNTSSTVADVPATHRWLLSRLADLLQHHLRYTCRVKRHGIILFRAGREIDALSHALFMQKQAERRTEHTGEESCKHSEVCNDVNMRLKKLITKLNSEFSEASQPNLIIDTMVKKIDPMIWETVCKLTHTSSDAKVSQTPNAHIKKIRRLFIIMQMVFCMDNRCSMPFHVLIADLIDCFGGSTELIRILNRLGVCASTDTLLRHINTVVETDTKGILRELNPAVITLFSMDNIDFLQSHAQVFCGNQQLSWHGTTVQAVQPKPTHTISASKQAYPLPPTSSPTQSPMRKKFKGRTRTGTEKKTGDTSINLSSSDYNFSVCEQAVTSPQIELTIQHFRPTEPEQKAVNLLIKVTTNYCLLKQALTQDGSLQLSNLQTYVSIYQRVSNPQKACVAYVSVLDEKADNRDTVLNVINNLYVNYLKEQSKTYVVLEGDAPTFDIIQSIKTEYGLTG